MMALADLTTLGVGGPAAELVDAVTETELVDAVSRCDAADVPVLIVGGGSNVLISDGGYDGTVVRTLVRGISVIEESEHAIVTAACGEPWDDVVRLAVERGWSGIDALSGIPGLAGATPIQNVGAYGQEVSQTVSNVRVWDREERRIRDLRPEECAFGYRDSVFKHQRERWVVLAVSYRLPRDPWTVVGYTQLADALGIEPGAAATSAAVRDAVMALRRSKGMVLDPEDPDTRSAGSFFTNPIVSMATAAAMPDECPRYPASHGVKVSAAWLIEHAGIGRGWQARPGSSARVSTKHTLALTNTGGASAADVLELARAIRSRVAERFGIELLPEPVLVNCTL